MKKLFGRITRRFRKEQRIVLARREADPIQLREDFDGATTQRLWRGVDMLIDQLVLESLQAAMDPLQSHSETKFHLGGAAFGANLKARMLEQAKIAADHNEEERKRKAQVDEFMRDVS